MYSHGTARTLTESDLNEALYSLAPRLTKDGLARLGTEERYLLGRALSELEMAQLTDGKLLPATVSAALTGLDSTGGRTFARVMAHLIAQTVADGTVYELDRSPLPGGPAALFVPNVGGQYPVRGGTVGNRSRNVLGVQPPIGSFYVASWLALLGVEVRAFNLELGDRELEDCAAALQELGERVYFLFSTSNFFTPTEIESMYLLADLCGRGEAHGYRPRLVGAGYSSYFCRREYLEHTPVEVVVGPHGETGEADMIFSSPYRGPADPRPAYELFRHIPNLHLAVPGSPTFEVYDTPRVKLSEFERRTFSGGLDVRLMELDRKYWTASNIMDVCAPDDLNIPLELVGSPAAPAPAGGSRERSALSLANYVHRPNAIKMMTVFGSCPRACEFCQLTQWGEQLYFYRGQEAVNAMNRAAEVYPGLRMYIFEDDDFLLRRAHVENLIATLRDNKPTEGKIFYVSTVPMEVDPGIILGLREVGFRAMLLGLESPVERVARQIGKFASRYDFAHVLEAPRIGHDAGLHIRVTAIPFYPLLREDEIGAMADGLLDYLTYGTGISVAVHPLVKAAPGIELIRGDRHTVTTHDYPLPDGSGRVLQLLRYVMPDDPAVREVALEAIAETPAVLAQRQDALRPAGRDHPSQLGVLALLSATVRAWRRSSRRSVDDAVLDALDARLEDAFAELGRKHLVLSDVQDALLGRRGAEAVDPHLTPGLVPYVQLGLRMAADYGSPEEAAGAATLAVRLSSAGLRDWATLDSLRYAMRRPMPGEQRRTIAAALDRIGAVTALPIRQSAPKLLPLASRRGA